MAKTDIGRAVPLLKGEYNPATTYELNDIVSLNGSLYWHYSHEETTNVAPQATSTWKVVLSLADAEAYIARAETAAGEAEDAKDAALAAQTAAETASTTATGASATATAAKNDAVTAKTAAETAQAGAVSAKNDAVTAKEAAQTAASSAGTSATNANNSAGTAQYYAESAGTSASTATTKAGEASASASTASTAATTATTKASEASASATTATTKAGEASTSATSAASSAAAAQAVKDSIPEDYSQLSDDVSDLKTQLGNHIDDNNYFLRPTVLNAVDETDLEDGYYGGNGEPLTGNFKRSVKYTPCVPGANYKMVYRDTTTHYFSAASGGICFYDIGKKFIERIANQSVYIAPINAAYFRFYIGNSYTNYAMVFEGNANPAFYVPYAIEYKTSYQTANEENIVNSFYNNINVSGNIEETWEDKTLTLIEGKFIDVKGFESDSALWKYGYVDCKPNTIYKTRANGASACYRVCVLDNYGRLLNHYPETATSGLANDKFVTPYNAAKIIINGNSDDNISISELTQISIPVYNDILSGKKLYCGGDSITEGANVGTFPDGYKKTYSGYVAERNEMIYVSDAIGGSCMGNVMIDGWNYNAFCVNRYQNIPADADFITLWFGWNDNAYGWKSMREAYCVATYSSYYSALTEEQKAEVDAYKTWKQWLADYVGNVNSTSDTTWSGAWSKVLAWILDNRPNARVGVIVAYGMYTELSDALIAVCEKFGVSYVKAYEPHEFFSVGHSNGIGDAQAAKRKALYTLDNTHPNELGYEMMSAYYEQFLRMI